MVTFGVIWGGRGVQEYEGYADPENVTLLTTVLQLYLSTATRTPDVIPNYLFSAKTMSWDDWVKLHGRVDFHPYKIKGKQVDEYEVTPYHTSQQLNKNGFNNYVESYKPH